jgi:YD repeat-containing protein
LDGLGRHLRTQDASDPGNVGGSGGVTDYWFDAWGHPLAIRDARGAVTRAVHDAAGRRYATHDPNQGSSLYLYSGFGELLRQVDARGLRQDFRYDGLGRQIERRTGGLAGCASSATARRATDYGNTCGATLIDTYFFDGVQQRGGGVDVHALGLPSGHERRITPAGGAERLERRVWDVFDSHGRVVERRTQQSLATAGPTRIMEHFP